MLSLLAGMNAGYTAPSKEAAVNQIQDIDTHYTVEELEEEDTRTSRFSEELERIEASIPEIPYYESAIEPYVREATAWILTITITAAMDVAAWFAGFTYEYLRGVPQWILAGAFQAVTFAMLGGFLLSEVIRVRKHF